MRQRQQILDSLERVYRKAFADARARGDEATMERLDFQFQRDQVGLEVLLDVRDLLLPVSEEDSGGDTVNGLLDTAQKLRNLTRLR